MSHHGTPEHTLTTSQVAARLGISRNTVLQRVTYGRLTPALQLPGKTGAFLFDAEQIEAIANSDDKEGASR